MADARSTAPGTPGAVAGAASHHGHVPTEFAPGWRGSLRLLRGAFRTLVAGQAAGQFGDGLAQVAFAQLVLFDIGKGATPARIATVLAATLLPFSVAGPLAGVFIDRWNRRRTLVVASWLRAGLALVGLGAALTRSELLAYADVLLMLSLSRFVLDAKGSVLPRTVPSEQLLRANAISGLAGLSAAFVGAVGGAMFVSASVSAGFLAAALSYTAAGLLFTRLPFSGGGNRSTRLTGALGRLAHDFAIGIGAVIRTTDLRRPLLAVWTHRLLLGSGFILLVLVADHRYHLSAPGYGLAIAVTGVAAFVGTVCAPWLVKRWRAQALLPLAFLPPAGAAVVAGYNPSLVWLLCALAVTAVAFQCLKVLADALVGRAAPEAVRGRVFALYDVFYNIGFVLAGLVMVPLWHVGHERALLWWIGAGYLAGWLVFARLVGGFPFVTRTVLGTARPYRPWPMRLAALAAAALPVLAFPKPAVWWLAWVALVPWLMVIRRAPSPRRAAELGWFGALGFLMAMHYWLLPSTTVLLPVATGLLAILWVPWAMLAWWLLAPPGDPRRLAAAVLGLPAGWVMVEAVRSWAALGGPWGLLGASQWRSPAFLASASLGGVWLVSYLIVAANVALVAVLTGGTWRLRGAAAGIVVAAVLVGPLRYAAEPVPPGAGAVEIAVVQAGVVHNAGARLQREIDATEQLAPGRFDLVVWGESSVGFDLVSQPQLRHRLEHLSDRVGSDLLVNVDARSPGGSIRKTSVLIGPDGIIAQYSKMRLVPFGEYIPLRPVLGWLASVSKAAAQNRVRGDRIVVMHAGPLAFAPLICFESAFPDMSRTAVAHGAELLVFQTATTTFQGSWAPDQHASLAAVRAAETGRPAVQATLSGTTAAFDAQGHLLVWSPAATGTVTVTVPRAVITTPYDTFGDWVLAWSFAILVSVAIALGLSRARLDTRPQPPVGDPVPAGQDR